MILSDNWIKRQCIPPSHLLVAISGTETRSMEERLCWEGITHTKEELEDLCNRYHAVHLRNEKEVQDTGWVPMIMPFHAELIRQVEGRRVISYGVSSYGYDIRLAAEELKVFTNLHSIEVDPRNVDPQAYTTPRTLLAPDGAQYVLQPPNSIMLGHTVENFCIPRDVLGQCLGKSTYARVGVSLIVTPLEPGWEGQLVVEIVNNTNSPVRIYIDQGIGQLNFFKGDRPCDVSYADRGGKYQNQAGTTDSRV